MRLDIARHGRQEGVAAHTRGRKKKDNKQTKPEMKKKKKKLAEKTKGKKPNEVSVGMMLV